MQTQSPDEQLVNFYRNLFMPNADTLTSQAEIFPWSHNFATGIEAIDVQHHKLVDLLNKLACHMAFGSDVVTLHAVFDELADYAVYHFETEEGLWNQYLSGDDMTLVHAQSHQDFVDEVLKVRQQAGGFDTEQAATDLVAFLTHWLAFHILEEDVHMAHIVLGLQRGESLQQAKVNAVLNMKGSAHVLIAAVLNMYDSLSERTLTLLREVDQRRRAEEKLRLASNIIESSTDAIFVTDPLGLITDVNPAFCQNVQRARESLLNQPIAVVKSDIFDTRKGREAWLLAQQTGHWEGELGSRTPDGELETVWLKLSVLKDKALDDVHFVGMVSSISQLVLHHHALEAAANFDVLTGLPNRRLLSDRLTQALERSKRSGTCLAVCYLDLDNFKPVNDAHGHDVGDKVLQVVAQRMLQVLRGADTVARIGGDEFVLLLGDLMHAQEATPLIERLLFDIVQPIQVDQNQLQVGASLGATLFPADASTPQELLKHADWALYQAKAQGKGCYRLFATD
jgi:diguanylate cyclase (GGDEF)-like protein/hemerythrin-like metal-binding protein/PAS domain S-box-containing protein